MSTSECKVGRRAYPNLDSFYRNFTAMRFLRYNSAGLHFQESIVVLNDSAVKNGWDIVIYKIFRPKNGSEYTSNEKKQKKHILQYLNVMAVHLKVLRVRNRSRVIGCWLGL